MSDSENTPRPRRSGRERKIISRLGEDGGLSDSQTRKRKRSVLSDTDATGDESELTALSEIDNEEPEEEPEPEIESDRDDAYKAPTYKAAHTNGKRVPKQKAPKKPRLVAPKERKRKSKKAVPFDITQVAADMTIKNDNALFNSILNPASALQTTVEDFLSSFAQTPNHSLADLMNCVLRCCGCNDSVDQDQVVDYDGIVDALETFTEGMRNDDSPVYPLTSKLPAFKRFRKSMGEFLERLVKSAAEAGVLHDSDLLPTILPWVVAMSSSALRNFRHTATSIALEIETALCDVASAVDQEVEIVQRQIDGERKKKGKAAGAGRDKVLEAKRNEVKERKAKIVEFIKEFFDSVFVHRYRDLDPSIRSDCVQALGQWFLKYSAYFLDGLNLRYIGWLLNDSVTTVRLAAVKALGALYAKKDFSISLSHFTDRFKSRLVEMAIGDIDIGVRVATIGLLRNIDRLEEHEKDKLCLMAFSGEPRVRKAISIFVKGIWEEEVEERMVGQPNTARMLKRVGIKVLASLLVKWSQALDQVASDPDSQSQSQSQGDSHGQIKEISWLVNAADQRGRMAMIVEALSDEIDVIGDWKSLLEHLLLDHSAEGETTVQKKGKKKQAPSNTNSDETAEEVSRLTEEEEGVMLEVLTAVLRIESGDAKNNKEGDEAVNAEITRALIEALPKLFAKHQTDEGRISEVLLIPQCMALDMYLEMRLVPAYEALWDAVQKQFVTHSSPTTLAHAAATIHHMLNVTALSKTNATKIAELEDDLSSSLRDVVSSKEELEVTTFDDDELIALTGVCSRLAVLIQYKDMVSWMEENEDGKQASIWEILRAIAERGKLGYKEEEYLIVQILDVLVMHVTWKVDAIPQGTTYSQDDDRFCERLRQQRDALIEIFTEYVVGNSSNACESVKRTAFHHLLNFHILFSSPEESGPYHILLTRSDLKLSLTDEAQYRLAGFVQSEIERYAEELADERPRTTKENLADTDNSDDEVVSVPKKGKGKGKKSQKNADGKGKPAAESADLPRLTRASLEREYAFNSISSTFLRAVRGHTFNVRHCGILLAHYGRLDPIFDSCMKLIVDVLKEEGMFKGNGEVVVSVVLQALRDSFTLFLDDIEPDETHTLALAKILAGCFVIRGPQLSIIRRLDAKFVVDLHLTALSWVVKQIASYQTSSNKRMRNKTIIYFRVLIPFLATIKSQDALKIKAHLDQIIAQAKFEIPPNSKIWEPYRAYEKRLTAALMKDKSRATKQRKEPGVNGVSDAEQTEATGLSASENEADRPPPSQRRGPHPRPRPTQRSNAPANGISLPDDDFSLNFDPNAPPPQLFSPTALSELTPSVAGSNQEFEDDKPPTTTQDDTNDAMEVDQELAQINNTPTQKRVSDVAEPSSDLPTFKSRRKRF
ncbi:hypothetical protein SISSUDRAFT_1040461 [Sistotremastrum suecicum HHB10207 ss-3]|uniref:SCD domain-containing protein n=1 Tax=Sistotremastrum suecicum HHB10207 ss-3 TaxID=1314776 RepID=A0A166I621_9AGAM|nr:hypothetical protein SISSUDRAFT_1040461 [Sistotremastrum suecicum HHB10207 ss-3]